MFRVLTLLLLTCLPGIARAATCTTPPNWIGTWPSYQSTGNPADIKTATAVGNAIGQAVQASGGMAVNLTACNPTITGGSAASLVRTGGSDSGTDTSAAVATVSGASTARTLAAKLQEIVSVRDFGALGNGTSDDTTAFQNAVNFVCSGSGGAAPYGSGGIVYVPPGSYGLTHVSFPCNGVTIAGVNNGNVNSSSLDYRGSVIRVLSGANVYTFQSGMVTADYGGGIHVRDLGIDGSGMDALAVVFDFSWLQHSTIKNLSAYQITNFFREEGGAANTIEDVVILGLSGTGVEFYGDATNCGSNSGATMTLASCNKRADLLRVNRVNMNGGSGHTATCYAYHDFAQSLDVTSSICESAKYGLNAYCNSSQGNNGEACPAFGRFIDFETEDCTTCVNLSDTQDQRFYGGYYLGQGAASTHVFAVYTTNYGGAASSSAAGSYAQAGGIYGSRLGNSGGSAVLIGIADFDFADNQVFSSNLSDTNNSVGAPNVEVTATGSTTTPTRVLIHGNILCEASGQQPLQNPNDSSLSLIQGSVWLDSGVTNSKVFGNEYSRCSAAPHDYTTSDSTNSIQSF